MIQISLKQKINNLVKNWQTLDSSCPASHCRQGIQFPNLSLYSCSLQSLLSSAITANCEEHETKMITYSIISLEVYRIGVQVKDSVNGSVQSFREFFFLLLKVYKLAKGVNMNETYHNTQRKDKYPLKRKRGEDQSPGHCERSFPHTL